MEDGTLHGSLELKRSRRCEPFGTRSAIYSSGTAAKSSASGKRSAALSGRDGGPGEGAGVKRVEGDIWGADFHFERNGIHRAGRWTMQSGVMRLP